MENAKEPEKRFAFTVEYQGLQSVLETEIHFCEPSEMEKNRPESVMMKFDKALWDTGASNTVITDAIVQKLNLIPIDKTTISTANGPRESDVYLVNVGLPNRVIIPSVLVTHGDILGADALIGMDIIHRGDFAVTNKFKRTMMTFHMPSIRDYDFTKQLKQAKTTRNNRANHPTKKNKKRK